MSTESPKSGAVKTGTHLYPVSDVPADVRQYLHCAWKPRCSSDVLPSGAAGVVGLSDDQGIFQLLQLGTNESLHFRVGYAAVAFPPPLDGGEGVKWDSRPWSRFCFVPGRPNAVLFMQWQSDAILWAELNSDPTNQCDIWQLGRHARRVRALAMCEDGKFAASGSDKGDIMLWHIDSLSLSHHYKEAHDGATTALKFHQDWLFSAGTDQRMKWWQVSTGSLLTEFVVHASPILDITTVVGPTNSAGYQRELLLGAHADGTLSVWSLETRSMVCSAQDSDSTILSVAGATSNHMVLTGALDGKLCAYRPKIEGAAGVDLLGSCELGSSIVCISFEPDQCPSDDTNKLVCICCRDSVQCWSVAHVIARIQEECAAEQQKYGAQAESLLQEIAAPTALPSSPEPMVVETPVTSASANAAEVRPQHELAATTRTAEGEHLSRTPNSDVRTEQPDHAPKPNETKDALTITQREQSRSKVEGAVDFPRHPALASRRNRRQMRSVHFSRPADANYGDPLRFASILSARAASRPGTGPKNQAGTRSHDAALYKPALNSTAKLALKLEAVQQERFPTKAAASAAEAAISRGKVPSLVNFSRDDRKYPSLPALPDGPIDPVSNGLKIIPKQLNERWVRGLELKPDIKTLYSDACELEFMAPSSTVAQLRSAAALPLRELCCYE